MMGSLGLGVMINMLGGNKETVKTLQKALGKEIAGIRLEDDALHLDFADGYKIKIFDDGQSCCEDRYMQTDDDLPYFVGANFTDIAIKDGPTTTGEYDEKHEIQFLEITTNKGVFTMASHNEHNGYYGGFWIVAVVVQGEVEDTDNA